MGYEMRPTKGAARTEERETESRRVRADAIDAEGNMVTK
jgi:hypothetical protein